MHRFLFLLFLFTFSASLKAQTVDSTIPPIQDSTIVPDTVIRQPVVPVNPYADSVSKRPPPAGWSVSPGVINNNIQLTKEVLDHHPWMGFAAKSYQMQSRPHFFKGKELLFYSMILFLIIYALLKLAFPKYFNDLFRLFFRTTLKQRQIRDQLMQTPLPSLLLNSFFVVAAGIYGGFLLEHYGLNRVGNFWLLCLYCSLGLAGAYFVKFLGLKISGWLFNMKEGANAYIFIVFVVNKMIGILLVPFIILLAFSTGNVYSVSLLLSYCLLAGMFAYRFFLSFAAIRNQVKVNPFHFFLYFLAFEVAPLLLIYNALLQYFRQTA